MAPSSHLPRSATGVNNIEPYLQIFIARVNKIKIVRLKLRTSNNFQSNKIKLTMTDMHTAALMADHFDKIQKLPNPVEGVPNFRCVPGYQVFNFRYKILI